MCEKRAEVSIRLKDLGDRDQNSSTCRNDTSGGTSHWDARALWTRTNLTTSSGVVSLVNDAHFVRPALNESTLATTSMRLKTFSGGEATTWTTNRSGKRSLAPSTRPKGPTSSTVQ